MYTAVLMLSIGTDIVAEGVDILIILPYPQSLRRHASSAFPKFTSCIPVVLEFETACQVDSVGAAKQCSCAQFIQKRVQKIRTSEGKFQRCTTECKVALNTPKNEVRRKRTLADIGQVPEMHGSQRELKRNMSSESKWVQVVQGRSQHVTRSESVATWWLEVELDVDHAPPNVETRQRLLGPRIQPLFALDCLNEYATTRYTRRLPTESDFDSFRTGVNNLGNFFAAQIHYVETYYNHCARDIDLYALRAFLAEQFGDRSRAAPMDLSSLTGITPKRAAASATLLETDHLTGMASPAGLSSGEQSARRLRGPASPDFLRDCTNPLMMTYFILGFCGNCKEEVRHFPARNYRINSPRDGDLDLATFGLDVQFGHNGRATRDRGYCTLTEPRRFLRCACVPRHSRH
ncbi:hypothetical protein CPB85DRAFT_1462468 [Mucidula mucida]|nr:hypothetical protein CPB85DRAFT_1462468 [Mucidula mucida]